MESNTPPKDNYDDLPDFQKVQYEFAAHIREPQQNPRPHDVADDRMDIYRNLFFNNVEGFISSSFPVLKQVLSEMHWKAMVRDFFHRHQCHSPYFLQISQEFLVYLTQERGQVEGDPVFMLELAHYEWAELALDVAEVDEKLYETIDANGDLLNKAPVLSPVAWSLCYNFPVHKIRKDFQPAVSEGVTYLMVYRNRKDRVKFLETNAGTHLLFTALQEDSKLTGLEALDLVAERLQHPNPELVQKMGIQTLEELRGKGVILGVNTSSI